MRNTNNGARTGFTRVHPISPHTFHGGQSLASAARGFNGNKGSDGGQGNSFVLRLSNDGLVTSDAGCGRFERTRREKARALRFRAAVFVNGSKVWWCNTCMYRQKFDLMDKHSFEGARQRLVRPDPMHSWPLLNERAAVTRNCSFYFLDYRTSKCSSNCGRGGLYLP